LGNHHRKFHRKRCPHYCQGNNPIAIQQVGQACPLYRGINIRAIDRPGNQSADRTDQSRFGWLNFQHVNIQTSVSLPIIYKLGSYAAGTVAAIGIAYFVALIAGFLQVGFDAPITDPVLAIMEVLTILSALALLVTMAIIHHQACASSALRI